MPDPVAEYQNRQLNTLNSDIATEQHNADWSSWFSSVPPADALRQQRNVTQLVADAIDRKQGILAETNEAAQRIHLNNQKFNEWQRQQPMREELLQNQIDHEAALTDAANAHSKYEMGKDIQSAQQFVPFVTALSSLPPDVERGSKEHHDYIYNVASQYPDAAMSTAGREILTREAGAFDRQQALNSRQRKLYDSIDDAMADNPQASSASFGQTEDGRVYFKTFRTSAPKPAQTNTGLFDAPDSEHYPTATWAQNAKGHFYIKSLPAPQNDSLKKLSAEMAAQNVPYGTSVFADPTGHGVARDSANKVVRVNVSSGGATGAVSVPEGVWDSWHDRAVALSGGKPAAAPQPSAAPSASATVRRYNPETGKIE